MAYTANRHNNIRGEYEISTSGTQALMGVMAVALVAGMSVKSLQMKVCLIKSKSAVRYW